LITMILRYMVFNGECYYPGGGMIDFEGSYDDKEKAIEVAKDKDKSYQWAHVYDTHEMKYVWPEYMNE
jgi:hypothetical protein